ncbi:mitotic apparatus protein p62-like [Xenia sp. Carnegie-2017]|uniref:mitotic apparatus protein p62-like n=1 Tax=Xenia sp. Carnegie-2017 TaxID=2897299 RepID=UPI001F036D15|nr:mitotic apparatus protein p62-like [Xenia sp. Carnegie-2017]
MASLERQYFWGCTLSKDKQEYKWLGVDDKDVTGEVDIVNQLVLSQAVRGPKARDGPHVVQVTTSGINNDVITQPIIVISPGVNQVQCRLEFSTEATFKLVEGNGPIHLCGSHVQVLVGGDDDDDSDDQDDEHSDQILAPPKRSPVKEKRSPSTKKQAGPPSKKARLENGEDKSKSKSKKTAAKADASDEEEDSGDDDEDDDDDDFDPDSNDDEEVDDDDDEEDDEDDDDDDDDDEDDDDDDDDDNEDDSDEELVSPNAKGKTQPQTLKNSSKKAGTPKISPGKDKNSKSITPKKGQTPQKVDASVKLPKTPDLNAVKQKLLKSPNLPRKIEKFKNFMKTNMRITDDATVKDLWSFVQANKK